MTLSLPILALIDATSTGTLVIPLMLLLAGRGSGRAIAARTVLYLAVIWAFYLLLGIALLAGLLPVFESFQEMLGTLPGRIVLVVLGAGLLAWSFHSDPQAVRKRGGDPEAEMRRWTERARRAVSSWRLLVLLALLAGVIEALSMIPYIAAMGVIADAGWGFARGALTLVGYCLLMIAPALVLTVIRMLVGQRADALLGRAESFAVRQGASALSWGTGIIGVIILLRVVPELIRAVQG